MMKWLTNLFVKGYVQATKFTTTGGTSSDFVKGDGSLDGNTYALDSDLDNYLLNTTDTLDGDLSVTGQISANEGNSDEWNEAHDWGDHSSQGYLTSVGWTDLIGSQSAINLSGFNDDLDYDNYGSWNLKTNGVQRKTIQSGDNLDLVAGTNIGLSYGADGKVTINSSFNNTTYTAGTGLNLTGTEFIFDTAWGDGRYLQSFTETDPTVPSHVKNITTGDISNWNDKAELSDIKNGTLTLSTGAGLTGSDTFSANQGTNTTFTVELSAATQNSLALANSALQSETDPTVPSHVKSITTGDITDWNTAFGWGDFRDYGLGINAITPATTLTSTMLDDPDLPNGLYHIASAQNTGFSGSADVLVMRSGAAGYTTQKMQVINSGDIVKMYLRHYRVSTSTWTPWREVITDENLNSQATSLGFIKSSALPTVNNGQLTLSTGTGLTGSGSFSANQSTNTTFNVAIASGYILPTNTQVSNWNTAHTWGDHSTQGYLTSNQTITLSGDVSGSGSTAISVTIAPSAVEAGMLNNNIISGKTALTSGLVSTDELMISDNGTIKRMDVSVLQSYMQSNLTFSNNSGTVTSITTGTGLTGGPITSTGTISLDSSSISSLALADTALQPGDDISELNNDVGYATETYVDTEIANLVDNSPAALDTLNELAAALGDDPNFATTVSNQIGLKADKSTSIIAGTGLNGGGTLEANRTLSVKYGTAAGTAAQGNDSRLSNSREWTATVVSQSEAEAGTATTARKWTAQRVRQAILGWWNGSSDKTKLDGIEIGAQVNTVTSVAGQTGDVILTHTDVNAAPASHTHPLSQITDAGNLASLNTNASTSNFLRGDGTWVTPPNTNTTYTEITTAEIDAGTASTLRTITGRRMKHALDKKADVSHTHPLSQITDAGNLASLNTNANTSNFLRGDGTWATPPNTNTTYSEITTAEIDAGTASTSRAISGRRMKYALDKKSDTGHSHIIDDVTGLQTAIDSKANVSHTHTLSQITDAGNVAGIDTNSSTSNFLRGDGTWVTPPNTNTTYSAGTGLSLSGTTFGQAITTSGTGTFVTGITQTTNGFQINLGTPPNTNTTYSTGSLAELNTGTVSTGRVWGSNVLNQWLNGKGFSTQTLTAGSNITISGNTISATNTNTTYSAGSGLSLTGTTFANTAPNATHTGDVTGSTALTIANSAVTHAKYQNIATQRILGRGATGTGNVQELTLGANLTLSTTGVLNATNTNTTYSAGAGLNLTGTAFGQKITTSGTGTFVTGITQTTDGFQINLGTPPNTNTTYTEISEAEINAGTASTPRAISGRRMKFALDKKADVSHTHTLSQITDAGNVAALNTNSSTANFLRGDGTWVTPPNTNTTYSAGTLALLNTGTNTSNRVWSAKILNDWLVGKEFSTQTLTAGSNITISGNTISATNTNTTYSAGSGLTLSGTTFSLPITYSGTGNYVSAVTQTTNGLTVTRSTLPTFNDAITSVSRNGVDIPIVDQNVDIPIFSTTGAGLVPARVGAVATKYLREDGSWTTPTNTTYSEITTAEIDAGTSSTRRAITGRRMKYALDSIDGLKKIGDGYGLKHQVDNPTYYGTLGENAVNLSNSTSVGNYGATGTRSHAEGNNTTASALDSHAEGRNTIASGPISHAEGFGTEASNVASHAEGRDTIASGTYSHAEGTLTTSSGDASHAEGHNTTAGSFAENARGTYNEIITPISTDSFNLSDVIESVGVGTGPSARKNALTRWKNGAWKWLMQDLKNVENAVKGFHATDLNGRLNYYTGSGSGWKKYLIKGEVDNVFLGQGTMLTGNVEIDDSDRWDGKTWTIEHNGFKLTSPILTTTNGGTIRILNDSYVHDKINVIMIHCFDAANKIYHATMKAVE